MILKELTLCVVVQLNIEVVIDRADQVVPPLTRQTHNAIRSCDLGHVTTFVSLSNLSRVQQMVAPVSMEILCYQGNEGCNQDNH